MAATSSSSLASAFSFPGSSQDNIVGGNGVVEQELQVHVLGTILPQSLDALQCQTNLQHRYEIPAEAKGCHYQLHERPYK
jgi:hypothetical protein